MIIHGCMNCPFESFCTNLKDEFETVDKKFCPIVTLLRREFMKEIEKTCQ